MIASEITLVTNHVDKAGIQNIVQSMTGVMAPYLNNEGVSVIFDSRKTHYDRILENITLAGYRIIGFYVTEDDEN